MALKTVRCCNNASLPEQRSALRAIHPLTPPKIITACSGGCCPSVQRILAGLEAGVRGPFLPALAMAVTVVVCVSY